MAKFYVYILQCADGTYYTGYTNDVLKRVYEHNNAKSGAHYTKIRRPIVLKYTEQFCTLSEALKREYEIKHLKRKEKEKLWVIL